MRRPASVNEGKVRPWAVRSPIGRINLCSNVVREFNGDPRYFVKIFAVRWVSLLRHSTVNLRANGTSRFGGRENGSRWLISAKLVLAKQLPRIPMGGARFGFLFRRDRWWRVFLQLAWRVRVWEVVLACDRGGPVVVRSGSVFCVV